MANEIRDEKDAFSTKRRSEAFERNSARVMAGLDSLSGKRRMPEEFAKSLAELNVSLFAMSYFFLRCESNPARRGDLAEEARQIWHEKMLAIGFKSYLTKGKPFGKPFGPYAKAALYHICISLMRGRDRVGMLASFDGFSDPRRDPRDAGESPELERDCRESMEILPPKWQELLRLIYWHGLSVLQAAERLQTNPCTAATWHSRSRKRLGDEFRKRGYWPP